MLPFGISLPSLTPPAFRNLEEEARGFAGSRVLTPAGSLACSSAHPPPPVLPSKVHIQTIGILVSEKSELQTALAHTQQAARQKAGGCALGRRSPAFSTLVAQPDVGVCEWHAHSSRWCKRDVPAPSTRANGSFARRRRGFKQAAAR